MTPRSPMLGRISCALSLLASIPSQAAITAQQLEQQAAQLAPRVIEWRRDFHQHPELSNREFRTAKIVAEHLRKLGLEVRTGIAHTGVAAVLRGGKPGPLIALRADMDALPITEQVELPFRSTVTAEYRGEQVGVMHACGHDAHTAMLMGVAEILTGLRKDLPGSVLFIFQPAEEGPPEGENGGASLMLAEGLFERFKPAAIFGLHVSSELHAGDLGVRSGAFMAASDSFRILVTGRQTHGARPWDGVDPIVTAAQIVGTLQTIVSRSVNLTANPAVVTVGVIKGGVRFNIIPDTVEMLGTLRTFDPQQRADILAQMQRVATNVAAANGARAGFELLDAGNPVTYNNPALSARVAASLRGVAGEEHFKDLPIITAAEDFAYFARAVPAVFFNVGIIAPAQDLASAASNHSPLFLIDESGIAVGLRAMLRVAVDYLNDPRSE